LNALDFRAMIHPHRCTHVYGANIGAVNRWIYAQDGSRKPFVSGYSNARLPNLWDRSKEVRP
jgi:predicted metal-dependent enzyme (double-stranded beta helix superfamily)